MSLTPSQRWLRRSSGRLRLMTSSCFDKVLALARLHATLLSCWRSGEGPMSVGKLLVALLLATTTLAAIPSDAPAQAKYPNRPIRLLLPFAPGGGVDVVARVVSQKVSEALGQPILIESKPGAGGAIATNELMRA